MIRVLSDLHYAHPASLIKEVGQIEPLLEGVRTVVFNGDTVELRLQRVQAKSRQYLETLQSVCKGRGIEPVVLNGNHDPDASGTDHLDLLGGRLFITHGHVLFDRISPWAREAKRLGENYVRALEELVASDPVRLEDRLQAVKLACLRTPAGKGKIPGTGLEWAAAVLAELSHPARTFEVLRAWAECPDLAAAFLRQHRPQARCIIVGHTHRPGHWMRGDTLVLNTGAYLPWFGRRVVDILEDTVVVRTVERKGKLFHPGKELLRWSLAGAGVSFGKSASGLPAVM